MIQQRGEMVRRVSKPLLRGFYELNGLRWRLTKPITVGGRLIMAQGDEILLVKHSYQPQWYLPGGGIKKDEI
jgi:hypothetical protein